MSTLGLAFNVQKKLSQMQITPVVGPLLVSPIKAAFSLVQFISALAATIFFGSLAILTLNAPLSIYAFRAVGHQGLAITGFAYAIVNLCTFGLIGHKLEHLK